MSSSETGDGPVDLYLGGAPCADRDQEEGASHKRPICTRHWFHDLTNPHLNSLHDM